jgi:hypothetical protein
MANSSRYSRWLIRAWVEAHHGGAGTGSRQRGELARAEEKGEGKKARRVNMAGASICQQKNLHFEFCDT